MICYQNTNDPIECPYCKSIESCNHLFALFDETFDSIEGGMIFDNDKIEDLLKSFFIILIKLKGFNYKFKKFHNSYLEELWNDIIYMKEDYLINGNFDEDEFILPNYNKYMFNKLDDIISPEFGEFEGGPGQSSLYKIYYTDNVMTTCLELKNIIESEIENIKNSL